jgi:hypothetical protein
MVRECGAWARRATSGRIEGVAGISCVAAEFVDRSFAGVVGLLWAPRAVSAQYRAAPTSDERGRARHGRRASPSGTSGEPRSRRTGQEPRARRSRALPMRPPARRASAAAAPSESLLGVRRALHREGQNGGVDADEAEVAGFADEAVVGADGEDSARAARRADRRAQVALVLAALARLEPRVPLALRDRDGLAVDPHTPDQTLIAAPARLLRVLAGQVAVPKSTWPGRGTRRDSRRSSRPPVRGSPPESRPALPSSSSCRSSPRRARRG